MGTAAAVDTRSSHRSNVFLAAVIHAGGSCYPVRIRNLSETGALIDGKDVPPAGNAVRIQRGPHSAVATIVWRMPGACGVRFSSAVPVQEWIAYASGHNGQRRVDEIVASVRADVVRTTAEPPAIPPSTADCVPSAEQLDLVYCELEEIAAELACDPSVVERSAGALQRLDIATQQLIEIARNIRAGGR